MSKDEEKILCGCTALSLAQLRRHVATSPHLSFEGLLAQSGAGTRCTACLLDLEYYFVEAGRTAPAAAAANRFEVDDAPPTPQTGLKSRLYAWLDRVSPLRPYVFNNSMPVLYGDGVEQWLWIVNRSMMFEGGDCAPTMRIDLTVRDHAGRKVRSVREDVIPESTFRFNLSAPLAALAPSGETPAIGSVEIRRRGLAIGMRGTTRPQVEILTATSACAVHSQAFSGAGQKWFTCLNRPNEERMFFSVLNGVRRETEIEFCYPMGIAGVEPDRHRIRLSPLGAALHEMTIPRRTADALDGAPVQVSWRAKGAHKVHAICATPQLDRFSIDHL